uniref:Flavodoxin-like fold domain-containing protein n=1 Tax=Callorhinchus milii TaxID=7868 RepID=A0A4W3JY49_CALMI
NLNAVVTRNYVVGDVHDPSHFNYGVEISEAYKKGILSKDVVEKQKKLKEADFVIFQFSLYWSNVPAILNGWIGQVFVEGMAYGISKCYNLGYFNKLKCQELFLFPIFIHIPEWVTYTALSPSCKGLVSFQTTINYPVFFVSQVSVTCRNPLP